MIPETGNRSVVARGHEMRVAIDNRRALENFLWDDENVFYAHCGSLYTTVYI